MSEVTTNKRLREEDTSDSPAKKARLCTPTVLEHTEKRVTLHASIVSAVTSKFGIYPNMPEYEALLEEYLPAILGSVQKAALSANYRIVITDTETSGTIDDRVIENCTMHDAKLSALNSVFKKVSFPKQNATSLVIKYQNCVKKDLPYLCEIEVEWYKIAISLVP